MSRAEERFRLLFALCDGCMPTPTYAGRYAIWNREQPGHVRWLDTEIEAMVWIVVTTPDLADVLSDALDDLLAADPALASVVAKARS